MDVRQGPSRQDVESGAVRVLLKTLYLNTYKLLYTDSGSKISAYRLTCASVKHQLYKPRLNKIAARWPAKAVAQFYFF